MVAENTAWQLEDFVDSLVVELDKTRETLAVKAINKPLSYTVKEVALDLNIFPTYDGDEVSFVTAQPGQQGASKVTIQLGSITDQQVRATTKAPRARQGRHRDRRHRRSTRRRRSKLRKLGVSSVDDLKQIEQHNVDLKQVTDNDIDYSSLANQINKSRGADSAAASSHGVSLSMSDGRPVPRGPGRAPRRRPDASRRWRWSTSGSPRSCRRSRRGAHPARPEHPLGRRERADPDLRPVCRRPAEREGLRCTRRIPQPGRTPTTS